MYESLSKPDIKERPPLQDQIEALHKAGWKSEMHSLGDHGYLMFWNEPDGESGYGTEVAYCRLKYLEAQVIEKAEMRERTKEILCNQCGLSVRKWEDVNEDKVCVGYYGLVNASVNGGFYSNELSDLVNYQFSLCEKCLADIFLSFKIPVKQELYI